VKNFIKMTCFVKLNMCFDAKFLYTRFTMQASWLGTGKLATGMAYTRESVHNANAKSPSKSPYRSSQSLTSVSFTML
jgi:hypothetical protein